MMTRKTSNPWRRLRLLYLLPVAAIIVAASSATASDLKQEAQTVLTLQEIKAIPEDITENPDVKPEFPGGEAAFMKYISNNVKYPDTALKSGKKGVVGVSFVVNKNGDVTNVEITQSVSPELDAEAVRVIKASPKWKPGMVNGVPVDVKMKVPFRFYLQQGKVMTKAHKSVTVSGPTTPKVVSVSGPPATRVVSVSTEARKQSLEGIPQTTIGKPDSETGNPKYAIVVNGKVISDEEAAKINKEDIAHITVIKGDQSAKYGEKAKEGAVIIDFKK